MSTEFEDRLKVQERASKFHAEARLREADRIVYLEPSDKTHSDLWFIAKSVFVGAVWCLIIVQIVFWLSGSKLWLWELIR